MHYKHKQLGNPTAYCVWLINNTKEAIKKYAYIESKLNTEYLDIPVPLFANF